MSIDKRRFDAEFSGALTPELEGAGRSTPHPRRLPQPDDHIKDRGETTSATTDLPSGPKRP